MSSKPPRRNVTILETLPPPELARFDPRRYYRMLLFRYRYRRNRARFHAFGPGSFLEKGVELLQPHLISLGSNVQVRAFSRLEATIPSDEPLLVVEDGVTISPFCHIGAAQKVILRKECGLASHVLITDHDHDFRNPASEAGYRTPYVLASPTEVGEGTFVGERVSILKGVKIGKRSIIGTNSVVTTDIPDYSIASGAPAKVIRRWDFDTGAWVPVRD